MMVNKLKIPLFVLSSALVMSNSQVAFAESTTSQDSELTRKIISEEVSGYDSLKADAKQLFENLSLNNMTNATVEEKQKIDEIANRIRVFYYSIAPVNYPPSGPVYYQYFETELSKNIEVSLNLDTNLTASDLATGLLNSNTARDAGVKYAKENGYGSVTWDNKPDALRHFTWNYLNSQSFGVNKARTIGDNHELALIGANWAKDRPNLTHNERVVYGTMYAKQFQKDSRQNDDMFFGLDNSTIMDLYNNSIGRQYSSKGYSGYMQAFNSAYDSNQLIGNPNQVTDNTRLKAWNAWQ